MKRLLLLLTLLFPTLISAQDDIKTKGLFYKVSLGATLGINEYYTINNEDEETLIVPKSLLFNNSVGYQFDGRSAIGINFEYNRYPERLLQFMPVYLNFRYTLYDRDDILFARAGYGRLVQIAETFESGTTYLAGLGYQIFDKNFRNSFIIGVDFMRKRFGFRQHEKLSSIALSFEFMLF